MNNINISDLAGSELFQDSETFLDQLSERELLDVQGGIAAGASAGIPTVDAIAGLSLPTVDVATGLVGGLPTANALAGLPTVGAFFPQP